MRGGFLRPYSALVSTLFQYRKRGKSYELQTGRIVRRFRLLS